MKKKFASNQKFEINLNSKLNLGKKLSFEYNPKFYVILEKCFLMKWNSKRKEIFPFKSTFGCSTKFRSFNKIKINVENKTKLKFKIEILETKSNQ